MRKIVLAMAMIASVSVMANHIDAENVNNRIAVAASDKFHEVDVKSLDPNIQEAIYKVYPNCLVKEAYMSDSNLIVKYKFVITTQDGKETRFFMNEKGEVVTY